MNTHQVSTEGTAADKRKKRKRTERPISRYDEETIESVNKRKKEHEEKLEKPSQEKTNNKEAKKEAPWKENKKFVPIAQKIVNLEARIETGNLSKAETKKHERKIEFLQEKVRKHYFEIETSLFDHSFVACCSKIERKM